MAEQLVQKPVHPRTCGEHTSSSILNRPGVGSSPHLRGTHTRMYADSYSSRFIPAPAGNTSSISSSLRLGTVHPRTCGEHSTCIDVFLRDSGSSPHLRGTRVDVARRVMELRFIPAPAGNTLSGCCRYSRTAVHPRTCGEHK